MATVIYYLAYCVVAAVSAGLLLLAWRMIRREIRKGKEQWGEAGNSGLGWFERYYIIKSAFWAIVLYGFLAVLVGVGGGAYVYEYLNPDRYDPAASVAWESAKEGALANLKPGDVLGVTFITQEGAGKSRYEATRLRVDAVTPKDKDSAEMRVFLHAEFKDDSAGATFKQKAAKPEANLDPATFKLGPFTLKRQWSNLSLTDKNLPNNWGTSSMFIWRLPDGRTF